MQVDYAGLKMQMIDPETGEIIKISVFVATLPASNYLYAETQLKEDQKNWNNGHARAFEYFGGQETIAKPATQPNGRTCQRITSSWTRSTRTSCWNGQAKLVHRPIR